MLLLNLFDHIFSDDIHKNTYNTQSQQYVRDLILEALNRGFLNREDFYCKHSEGCFFVFPVLVSDLSFLNDSEEYIKRNPVVMEDPYSHKDEKASNIERILYRIKYKRNVDDILVLYSDGSIGYLTVEEAKGYTINLSPMPILTR